MASSSIFSRPVSPPPRSVSPDVSAFTALSPPMRSKKLPERPESQSHKPHTLRSTPSKSILKPTQPSSSSTPTSVSFRSNHTLTHRRSIQLAIPYRSPPPSPTLASPPPPVPPIPAFVLDCPAPRRTPTQSLPPPPRPTRSPRRELRDVPPAGHGMTCSQFMTAPGRRNTAHAPSTA
ncbi:hypothetical protein BDP27DRAFT_701194 [Rhodocollybia butyracea]|uniref:Uncharacterized protein n=1 Tax=Rhodocollybia butyracea TaxID=206335 RepID=A0A9P5Q8M7_9AGAR|nr:hypothetical protein BDP27DRAFT_701194 [Rhodocollybia butyracea]